MNYISIIWLILCAKTALIDFFPILYLIDYVIWVVTACQFVFTNNFRRISVDTLSVIKPFLLLSAVQLLGCCMNFSMFSIRNIITTLCMALFVHNLVSYKNNIQIHFIRAIFYIMILIVFYKSLCGIELDNTMSGCVIFLGFGYAAIEFLCDANCQSTSFLRLIRQRWMVIISIVLALFSVFWAGARTSLAVLLIIIVTYILLSLSKMKPRNIKKFFWIVLIITVVGIIVYINVSNYSWYKRINSYSVALFDKNINSSRPYLWKHSIDSLSWWQWIIGKGTGILPEIERYANSSFHNSYIQLLMQNGIVGLAILIWIIKFFWDTLSTIVEGKVGKIMLAFLVGVIAYNCFESTLIQNKVFLGSIQWLILGIGAEYALRKSI